MTRIRLTGTHRRVRKFRRGVLDESCWRNHPKGREDRLLGILEFHGRMDGEISGTGWVKG